jgi:hypothetical protein
LLCEVMGSWGGWTSFVDQWGAFECRIEVFGGKSQKYAFSHFWSFLVTSGWLWLAMRLLYEVAGLKGNMGHDLGWLDTIYRPRAIPQLWQLWQLPHIARQSAQLCRALSKFRAHICRAISKFHAHIFKISRSSLSNFIKIDNKSQQKNSHQGKKKLQR